MQSVCVVRDSFEDDPGDASHSAAEIQKFECSFGSMSDLDDCAVDFLLHDIGLEVPAVIVLGKDAECCRFHKRGTLRSVSKHVNSLHELSIIPRIAPCRTPSIATRRTRISK